MTLAVAAALAGPFGVSALAGEAGTPDTPPEVGTDTTVLVNDTAVTVDIIDPPVPPAAADTPVTDPAAVATAVDPAVTAAAPVTAPVPDAGATTADPTVTGDTTTTAVSAPAAAVEVVAEPHVVIAETPATTIPPFDPPHEDPPVNEVPAEPEQGWPVVPIVFPVAGPVVYWDGWGQCREVDCSRLHVGVDIVGERLQPILAAEDGVITGIVENHRTAGWGLRLDGASGWQYRYYHLNNDTPGTDDGLVPSEWVLAPGVGLNSTVVAGQVIGWMGDSGNAETSAPHLHFEIRRPDTQEPINPFPSVTAAETAAQCSPMRADVRGAARYEQLAAEKAAADLAADLAAGDLAAGDLAALDAPVDDVRVVHIGEASYVVFNDKVYALSDAALNVGRRTGMVPCQWDYRFADDLITLETKPDLTPADGLNAFGTTEPFVLQLPGVAL